MKKSWQHAFLWSQSQRNLLITKPIVGVVSHPLKERNIFLQKKFSALPQKYEHRKGTRLKKGSRSSSIVLTAPGSVGVETTPHTVTIFAIAVIRRIATTLQRKKRSILLILQTNRFYIVQLVGY